MVLTATPKMNAQDRAVHLLSAIVDSSDDAIISKDLNSIITSWNRGAERLFGYTAEEAIGRPVTILFPPDRIDEEEDILARIRSGERVSHFETVRRRRNGTLVDISLTISPIVDARGVVIGASKIARDITERKRTEAQILRANKDLEQFAFSVSHDLQEPVRTVRIYTELLRRRIGDRLDGEELQFLGFVTQGAVRTEQLIQDLLAFTRTTQSQPSFVLSDANEPLKAALDGLAAVIGKSGAVITHDRLPIVTMLDSHLQQLFQNLIGNAIKYRSPDRTPTIHIGADVSGGHCRFSVRDNGIGIADEYKEVIFELFKRLHTSDEYSGTGIGLAICQRIVERYRGEIWIESKLGEGSTFYFTVPNG
jgi:PAS domain S-box-containing protein